MSVGKESDPATYNPAHAYYNLLVDGFRSGHLYLKREVPPGLAKLADPYDPAANSSYQGAGLHDTSYYKNKLYLYFGVTPAVVLFWPYAALTGHYLYHKQAVAIFCSVGFLVSVTLLCALQRRYFAEVGGWVVAAGALALGLATGVPAMLQRPDVWEVPISCAYAMVMLALSGVWRALHDPSRRCWWLAAASLAYGLAVGARPTVLFGAVILLVPVVHAWISPLGNDGRRWLVMTRLLAAAVGPSLFIGFGLMLYNYLRFDSPFEFGQHYQMSANKESDMHHLFGLNYLWFNFRVYFLQPVHWGGFFPFVKGIKVPTAPSGQLGVENPFGLLPNIPLVWMALAVPLAWKKQMAVECSALRFFVAAMVLLFGISALIVGCFGGACLRYEVDFVPVVMLLAACGILGLEHALAAKPQWRNLARGAWVAALLFSVAVGLLLSVQIYTAKERLAAGIDLVKLGRPNDAMRCFEQVLRIKPDSAEAHSNLGNVLATLPNRLPDAISEYEAALRINPDFAEVHNNLGNILATLPDRLSDAISEYEAALRINPDFAEAHSNLGNVLVSLPGRLLDAISEYEAALRINPDLFSAHNNLGNALAHVPGHLPEAIPQFEAALQIKPDYAEARENLERIRNMMARQAAESAK